MPTTKPARKRKPAAKRAKSKTRRKAGTKKSKALLEQLRERRRDILELYHQDVRAGQRASNYGAEDLVDRANSAYNREFMFSLSGTERALLQEIDLAIERHEAGDFGHCVNCKSDIGSARLDAVPWAKYCIDCQEMQEKGLLPEA